MPIEIGCVGFLREREEGEYGVLLPQLAEVSLPQGLIPPVPLSARAWL